MGYTMIAAFAGSLPGQMDEVRSTFENRDTPSLAKATHIIKRSAASLSAGSLVAAALALEKAERHVSQAIQQIINSKQSK